MVRRPKKRTWREPLGASAEPSAPPLQLGVASAPAAKRLTPSSRISWIAARAVAPVSSPRTSRM
ncbi:MAG: hypothetical protein DUD39_04225 [Coriobacteriaceae bacterium]|nr:MAG: hypothetical protein DUD39_04225 [Coriobacteriaceae bacterium]